MAKLTMEERSMQLHNAVELIQDSLREVKQGNKKYYITLAVQLRALIVVGNPRSFTPLLLDLAKEKNVSLEVWAPKSIQEMYPGQNLLENMQLRYVAYYVSLRQETPVMRKYSLKEWLETDITAFATKPYTPNDIIKTSAETEGAHYDKKMSAKYRFLKEFKMHQGKEGELEEIHRFLSQVSEVVLSIAKQVLDVKY